MSHDLHADNSHFKMAAPSQNVEEDVKYCDIEATVATGFEQTAREEVIEKLGFEVRSFRGKITIRTPISQVPRVLKLGTIDNCRVVIKHIRGFEFPKDQSESLQRVRELVKDIDWQHGIEVWSKVFNFDHPINASHENSSGDVGTSTTKDKETLLKKSSEKKSKKRGGRGKDKRKNKENKENVSEGKGSKQKENVEKSESPRDESDTPVQESGSEESHSQTKDAAPKGAEGGTGATESKKLICKTDAPDGEEVLNAEDETPESERAEVAENTPKPLTVESDLSSPEKTQENESKSEDPGKVSEKTQSEHDSTKPKFRVTCHRVGECHKFDSTNMGANFGGAIYTYFGWNVDLTKFDIEVILNIDWDDVSVCIGLTKESLHKRLLTNFGMTTLRPTIAYNMLRLCDIKCGDVVCDPMCGSGSIPISASVSWPRAIHMCGEIYGKAIEKTQDNLVKLNEKKKSNNRRLVDLDIYQWDATRLPLRDGCIDVFITDLPFGRKFGNKMNNQKLYPLVLEELARVTRKRTGRACFITEDKRCMTKLIQESILWQRRKVLAINMGGIDTGVYLLHRTDEDIAEKLPPETPEEISRKRKDMAEAQSESRRKYLEDLKKLTGGGGNAMRKKENTSQTSVSKPSTNECSSQVSDTNIASSESSAQTHETGSPRKRAKIEQSESEAQTTGGTEDENTPVAKGVIPKYTETRSQTTETSLATAETGSQIEKHSTTTDSGIQAQPEEVAQVNVKTRSQSSGTNPTFSDLRSQSTDTNTTTAETGSQATTTRNISVDTGTPSIQVASIGTDSKDVSTESGIQAALEIPKVDTGVGPNDSNSCEYQNGYQESQSDPKISPYNIPLPPRTPSEIPLPPPTPSEIPLPPPTPSEGASPQKDVRPKSLAKTLNLAESFQPAFSTTEEAQTQAKDQNKDGISRIDAYITDSVKDISLSTAKTAESTNKDGHKPQEDLERNYKTASNVSEEAKCYEAVTVEKGNPSAEDKSDKKNLDVQRERNDSFVHIKMPEYASCVDTGESRAKSSVSSVGEGSNELSIKSDKSALEKKEGCYLL